MNQTQLEIAGGPNYSVAHIGPLSTLDRHQFFHPSARGRGYPGKLFLKEPLALTGMEVSMNKLAAGASMPFNHRHTAHEELYIFLQGRGQFMVDGSIIDVREGTTIRVAPKGVRSWRNVSDEDMFYIVIQANDGSMKAANIEDGVMVPGKVDWPESA